MPSSGSKVSMNEGASGQEDQTSREQSIGMPFELIPTEVLATYSRATRLLRSVGSKLPRDPATASLYHRHIYEMQFALAGLSDMLHGSFRDLKRSPRGGKMWVLAEGLMNEVVSMLEDLDAAIDEVVEAEKEVKRQVDEVAGVVSRWSSKRAPGQ